MSNDTLALMIGGFLLAHGTTVATVFVFAFKHLLKYNILLKDFSAAQEKIEELEKDITAAHDKIRNQKIQESIFK